MRSAADGPPPWLRDGLPHVWLPYSAMGAPLLPAPVVRTEGSRIFLADGRILIDGVASWWTACHGYNHPHIAQAIRDQLDRAPHIMFGGLAHEPAYTLARRLAMLLPELPHVFFSDSGSVAVEVAMKMAAQYWLNRRVSGRTRFLSFIGGYHGDTLAAMSVCDPDEGMHRHFAGLLPSQIVVPLPVDVISKSALESVISRHVNELAGVRRGFHRLWPHWHDVRRRAGGHNAGYHDLIESTDRRYLGPGSHAGRAENIRGLPFRSARARSDAWAYFHGQSLGLCRGLRIARPVRAE